MTRLRVSLTASLLAIWVGFGTLPVDSRDHDKIDSGRPLSIDGARPLHLREAKLEIGTVLGLDSDQRSFGKFVGKIGYGFAPDQHVQIAYEPSWKQGSQAELGIYEIDYFWGLQREVIGSPAVALKFSGIADVDGRQSQVRMRAIAEQHVSQFGRLIVNGDITVTLQNRPGARDVRFGTGVGYAWALGMPRDFFTTALVEATFRQSRDVTGGGIFGIGAGIRRQVSNQEVIDIGFISEFGGDDAAPVRIVVGYTRSF